MRGPTSPYGSLSSLWGASKAAYSSAIDAPYAYLVRRRGISKGGTRYFGRMATHADRRRGAPLRNTLFAADEAQRIDLPSIANHFEMDVGPG
jgi:hypothetical protein